MLNICTLSSFRRALWDDENSHPFTPPNEPPLHTAETCVSSSAKKSFFEALVLRLEGLISIHTSLMTVGLESTTVRMTEEKLCCILIVLVSKEWKFSLASQSSLGHSVSPRLLREGTEEPRRSRFPSLCVKTIKLLTLVVHWDVTRSVNSLVAPGSLKPCLPQNRDSCH